MLHHSIYGCHFSHVEGTRGQEPLRVGGFNDLSV